MVSAACSEASIDDRPAGSWQSGLSAHPAAIDTTIGTLESAAKLVVSWQAPNGSVDHYEVSAASEAAPSETTSVAGDETDITIALLRSATSYSVSLIACMNADCSERSSGGEATATTAEETWQIHGSGSSYDSATRVVDDANTKASTIVYGEGAPDGFDDLIQLYYDPVGAADKGIRIATVSGATTGDPDSVSHFTAIAGVGLNRKDDPNAGEVVGPLTFQVVPMNEQLGGNVRLFFEGTIDGTDKAQLYSVDSVDGYVGRDFHTGSETLCAFDDITATGACPTTEVFGFSDGSNEAFREIRQAKLVLPRLDDWRWDGGANTPMVITLHLSDGYRHCSDTFFNAAYAIYDGDGWHAATDDDGCPNSWPGVQAPLPVHVGGPRYKLYFNNNLSTTGTMGPANMGGSKPIKVMYADARSSGDEAIVDFEDWDGSLVAREVRFVWPDGTELSEDDESRLDDYEVYAPTDDPDFLVMYANMSCTDGSCGVPFVGMAVLLNP